MALPKEKTALQDFTRISSSIFLHQPPATSLSTPSYDRPSAIIVCAWMDALPKHIAKYTDGYKVLYPSAQIIVITTTAIDLAFSTWSSNITRITPVLELFGTLPTETKLHLHASSNGGAFTGTMIARMYRERTGKSLPMISMVLDSSPGRVTFPSMLKGFSAGLPRHSFFRLLGFFGIALFYMLYTVGYWVLRQRNLVEEVRNHLNDQRLFHKEAKRLYIFGEGDKVVEKGWVEEHADEAEEMGYFVQRENFGNSEHVAHLLVDEARYWAVVERVTGVRGRGLI